MSVLFAYMAGGEGCGGSAVLKCFVTGGHNLQYTVDGRVHNLLYYFHFNTISVISGRWRDGKQMLCAADTR